MSSILIFFRGIGVCNNVKPIHPVYVRMCVSLTIISHGTRAIVQPLITAARTKGSILHPPQSYSRYRILHRCRTLRERDAKGWTKGIGFFRAFLHARLRRFHFPLPRVRAFRGSFFSFFFSFLSLSFFPFLLLSQSTLTMQRGTRMTHLSKKELYVTKPTRRIKIQLQKSSYVLRNIYIHVEWFLTYMLCMYSFACTYCNCKTIT